MGVILLVLAVVCELLAAFGVGNKFGLGLEPLGIAFVAMAMLVGPVTALVASHRA